VSQPPRVAAHERDSLGRDVTWTVAEGRHGRRWRELAIEPGGAVRSLTLQTDGQGAWERLEIAGGSGLLSLHPESNGSIHGNIASRYGVRHLSIGAVKPARVDVPGSLVAEAALCWSMARHVRVGESKTISVASVGEPASVGLVELSVDRRTTGTWELRDGDRRRLVEIDDAGLPVAHVGSERWPLEA
jgi:hypothetical protein